MAELKDLLGKTMASAENKGDELVFTTTEGKRFKLYHSQDCCESVSIESVARAAALLSQEDHAYLPKTPEEAAQFNPHEWVLEAMRRAYSMGQENTPEVTVLPDGSACFVASTTLPKNHWLYASTKEWDKERDEYAECPKPVLNDNMREVVVSAARHAIRMATACGSDTNFDPDALVQNFSYAMCGPLVKKISKYESE